MKRFANILLVVDESTDHEVALERAVALAISNQAALTVCDVVADVPAEMQMFVTAVSPAELAEIVVNERRDRLEEIVEKTKVHGLSISVRVRMGKPFLEVIRQVLECGHDLVIKSAEGEKGLKPTLFGSADMHLMRKCPCAVWVVNSAEHKQYRRILAAVDQDPEDATKEVLNRQILEMATSLALSEFSELHIVHAWTLFAERFWRSARSGLSDAEVDAMESEEAGRRLRWLKQVVHKYGNKADKGATDYLKPELHVVKGDPKQVIPATARDLDVDLVIMGTIARTGIPGFFMGNTAESILNQIDCSVLTIKPPGFESPVSI